MRRNGVVRRRAAGPLLGVAAALAALSLTLGMGGGALDLARADDTSPAGPTQIGGGNAPTKAPADSSAPSQAGGGSLPGQKPQPQGGQSPTSQSDAAPPLNPGFVDDYSRLWKVVEKGKITVKEFGGKLAVAQRAQLASAGDLAIATREAGRSQASLADAQSQFGVAVRDLYISGTTDIDLILGVMGSKPDDVLRNIDSFVYLRSASGTENGDFALARVYATEVESAVAAAQIRASQDVDRAGGLGTQLAKVKRKLKIDEKELQRLIAAAAPQTVVSKDGCPKSVLDGTVPVGIIIKKLCGFAVRHAATPQAAVAIKWALVRLGAPYACEGIGRMDEWRYDCSSYVSRAYAEGAGLGTAGDGWAPSTRNMVPWDGVPLDQHYAPIPPSELHPGDLVLYDTCPEGQTCPYRHVVMYLGPMEKGGVPMVAHTNGCGLVAHVSPFEGTDVANFLGARRVVALKGEKIQVSVDRLAKPKKPKPRRP